MLKKINRLQKEKDIEKVLRRGKAEKEGLLVLKRLKSDTEKTRFGFLISKKVSKKAIERNKIKRRLRELVKDNLQELRQGTDNLLIALPGVEKKDFKQTKEMINKLFKKK